MKQKCNENLRKLRRENDYSQEYVADILGVSQKYYSNIENGKIMMNPKIITKLCNIFNVTPNIICQISCNCLNDFKEKNKKIIAFLKENKINIPKDLL